MGPVKFQIDAGVCSAHMTVLTHSADGSSLLQPILPRQIFEICFLRSPFQLPVMMMLMMICLRNGRRGLSIQVQCVAGAQRVRHHPPALPKRQSEAGCLLPAIHSYCSRSCDLGQFDDNSMMTKLMMMMMVVVVYSSWIDVAAAV